MPTSFFFLNDDSKILDAVRKGDENALAELFQRNRRPIASLVVRNGGSEDDAEDILQESLVVLWERVRSGTFEYQAKLSTFLYATAKNIWLRRLARRRHEVPEPADIPDPPDDSGTPLEELEENERTGAVRQAMEKLGSPCREILLLYYWEEQSMEAIAATLGFANADTAKSKKYQCKKFLERLVRELLGEED